MVPCPTCLGNGTLEGTSKQRIDDPKARQDCKTCDADGWVTSEVAREALSVRNAARDAALAAPRPVASLQRPEPASS